MKNTFFYAEDHLPANYVPAMKVDAGNKKIGALFTLGAAVITFGLMYLFFKAADFGAYAINFKGRSLDIIMVIALLVYTYLHEIVHGIVYWAETGIKPTFGLKLFCAFCGLPKTFVSRRVVLRSVVAPLIFFSCLFVPAILVTWHYDVSLYILFTTLLSVHLGGCIGDMFVTAMLLTKFRDPMTLSNDTGPCQTLYVPAV